MTCWIGYLVTFLGGGLAGAILSRFFKLKDRALQKLTLKAIREEIRSIVPVTIDDKTHPNLIFKEFDLLNKSPQDFDQLDLIFAFDPESVIVSEQTESKLGKNKCDRQLNKPNECVYHIKNFNRKQKVTFKFEVAGITKNFFSAIVDKTGVEIEIIHLKTVDKPSISPGKYVNRIVIDR